MAQARSKLVKIFVMGLLCIIASHIALADDDTTKVLLDQMRFLSERDKILAGNIANSDTPNYMPRELNKPKDINMISIKTTHPMHLNIESHSNYDLAKAEVHELQPNGNGVTLEHELLKKNTNAMEFQQTVNLYNKVKGMVNTAITGGGR